MLLEAAELRTTTSSCVTRKTAAFRYHFARISSLGHGLFLQSSKNKKKMFVSDYIHGLARSYSITLHVLESDRGMFVEKGIICVDTCKIGESSRLITSVIIREFNKAQDT